MNGRFQRTQVGGALSATALAVLFQLASDPAFAAAGSPTPASPVGWRTDGTGRYPDAQPPLTWSATNGIVWKTPMPDRSNASPAVGKDRLFVCAEPTTLLCVALADGAILWQRTNGYEDVLAPAEIASAKEAQARIPALQEGLKDAQKASADAAAKLKQAPADGSLKRQAEDLKAKVAAAQDALAEAKKFTPPPSHGMTGLASPTPVFDGERVYAVFGTGAAVCYDLNGKRLWARIVGRPSHDWGHSASPLLAGGKLVIHIGGEVHALDAKSGDPLWTGKAGARFGSPLHLRAGAVDVVMTAGGDCFRLSDGKALASGLGVGLAYCSPIVQGDVVYFMDSYTCKAARLEEPEGDAMATEKIWQTPQEKPVRHASPVLHEGLLYTIAERSLFAVFDAATGERVYAETLPVKGDVFASIAQAGKHIYVSAGATTLVVQPGREFKMLAENKLEDFRASPVFVGRRAYIRGQKNLYCIGE